MLHTVPVIQHRLIAAFEEFVRDPLFPCVGAKAAMAKQSNQIDPGTPEAAAAFLKSEQARYARLVAKANIKID